MFYFSLYSLECIPSVAFISLFSDTVLVVSSVIQSFFHRRFFGIQVFWVEFLPLPAIDLQVLQLPAFVPKLQTCFLFAHNRFVVFDLCQSRVVDSVLIYFEPSILFSQLIIGRSVLQSAPGSVQQFKMFDLHVCCVIR